MKKYLHFGQSLIYLLIFFFFFFDLKVPMCIIIYYHKYPLKTRKSLTMSKVPFLLKQAKHVAVKWGMGFQPN